MRNLFKIAIRNLLRYKRRTLLTASLVTIGVIFVLLYISVSGSFKNMMVAQVTDSMLGHLEVHRKGYLASIDNLPLNLNLKPQEYKNLVGILTKQPEVEAFSPRIKFGGMFSTFVETTNIRLNGVSPDQEYKTVPLLPSRIVKGQKTLNKGEILVPDLLARGMKVNVGDTVVIVATNKDGSVNGRQFRVSGVIEGVSGPGGRDGYIHIEDARSGENWNDITKESEKLISNIKEEISLYVNPETCHNFTLLEKDGLYNLAFHCRLKKSLDVKKAHSIITRVEDDIKKKFVNISEISIHVEPR